MKKRHLALLVTCLLMATTVLPASATDITGVTGVNGVYNIDPSSQSGDVGFRQYTNFELGQGDVANLKYDSGINTFVNLVDNRPYIEGIVNSVQNGAFYDGKAVFISPQGLYLGPKGVINVGSLGVYAPSSADYKTLKNNKTADNYKEFTQKNMNDGYNAVLFLGKVMTTGDVDVKSNLITVKNVSENNNGIMLGINKDAMQVLTNNEQAQTLFDQLVNTDGINGGTADIRLVAHDSDSVQLKTPVKNFGTPSTAYADKNFTGFMNGNYYDNGNETLKQIGDNALSSIDQNYTGYVAGNNLLGQRRLFYYKNGQNETGTIAPPLELTEISGVTGENGVYNINPELVSGSEGFREYDHFDLASGDVANLNYDNIDTFVNLVNGKIQINGLVNTVRDGNFYNGKAVFISPKGMYIGPDGVLNVGSLGVYAPSNSSFDRIKEEYDEEKLGWHAAIPSRYSRMEKILKTDNSYGGNITDYGKIFASGDVDLRGYNVFVSDGLAGDNGAGIVYGINEAGMETLTTNERANQLFNDIIDGNNYSGISDNNGNYLGFKYIDKNKGASLTIDVAQNSQNPTGLNMTINAPISNYAAYHNFTGYVDGKYFVDGLEVSKSEYIAHVGNDVALQAELDGNDGFTGFHNGIYYINGDRQSAPDNTDPTNWYVFDNGGASIDLHYTGIAGNPFSIDTDTGEKWSYYYQNGIQTGASQGYDERVIKSQPIEVITPGFVVYPDTEDDTGTGTPTKPGKITKGELGKVVLNPNTVGRLEKLTGQQIKADKVKVEKLNEALTNPNVTMKSNQLTTGALQLDTASVTGSALKQNSSAKSSGSVVNNLTQFRASRAQAPAQSDNQPQAVEASQVQADENSQGTEAENKTGGYRKNKAQTTTSSYRNDKLKPNGPAGRITITRNSDGTDTFHYNGVDDGVIEVIDLQGNRSEFNSPGNHAQFREMIQQRGQNNTWTY